MMRKCFLKASVVVSSVSGFSLFEVSKAAVPAWNSLYCRQWNCLCSQAWESWNLVDSACGVCSDLEFLQFAGLS